MSQQNRSTGPRTPEGKARSSQNARKHGLTAKDVVVAEHEREEFEDLRDSLQNELEPEGALEQLTFNQIVHSAWNLRRFHRLEAAMLSDPFTDPSAIAYLDRLNRYARQAERSYYRAIRELRVMQEERAEKQPKEIIVRWVDPETKRTRGEFDEETPEIQNELSEEPTAPEPYPRAA